MTIYSLRWNIETAYYEQKTFWALGDYPMQSGFAEDWNPAGRKNPRRNTEGALQWNNTELKD